MSENVESRKRRISSNDDDDIDTKRLKGSNLSLLSLSDDVLLLIFKYLSTAGNDFITISFYIWQTANQMQF